MKKVILKLIIIALISAYNFCSAQEIPINMQLDPVKCLVIANIEGSITLNGNSNEQIRINGTKYWDNTRSKNETDLAYQYFGDTLLIYIDHPCNQDITMRPDRELWQVYNWRDCHNDMQFHADLEIQVPAELPLIYLSTINDGDILVNNFSGELYVNNVNGGIELNEVSIVARARTINGDVTLRFNRVPEISGDYYSLNGDVEASFPAALAAKINFESFNGDLYTDFEEITANPITLVQQSGGKKTKYKLGSSYQIGNGGPELSFETFNGDVFIKHLK